MIKRRAMNIAGEKKPLGLSLTVPKNQWLVSSRMSSCILFIQ